MTTRTLLAAAAAICLASAAGCGKEKTCAADQQLCGNSCTTVQQDPLNCGACGNACPAGEACSAGACTTCASACGAGNRCVSGLCVADLYLACFNTDEVRGSTGDLQAAGLPIAVDDGPISLARLGGKLYAANSLSSSISELTFGQGAPATRRIGVFHAGAFNDLEYIAGNESILYVSNAAVNTLVAVDPARGVIDELPLGAGASPQGIDFSGTKAYVALNGTHQLAVVDVSAVPTCQPPAACARLVKTIDLRPLVAANVNAAPWRVKVVGNRVYVTLAHLDQNFQPAGDGKLAVVDTATDALVAGAASIDLVGCQNPGALETDGTTLYVACGHFDLTGAGIARVNVAGGGPALVDVVPTPGVAPVSIAVCSGRAYLGDRASGTIVRYDPSTGGITSAALCPPQNGFAFVPDVECSP
jgi:hypothetical protein